MRGWREWLSGNEPLRRWSGKQPLVYFFWQVALFTLFMLGMHLVAAVIQVGVPTQSTSQAASYDAVQRTISARLPSPKIMYVSGSSGFYGIRAEAIYSLLGMECVNLGLHAGLGAEYLLNRASALLSEGDICVLGLEYELYAENRPSEFLCDYLMSRDTGYLYSLGFAGYTEVFLSAGPARIWSGVLGRFKAHEHNDETASVRNVSTRGDRTNTLSSDRASDAKLVNCRKFEASIFGGASRRTKQAIDHFLALCRDRGVTVIAAYPPLCVATAASSTDLAVVQQRVEAFWRERKVAVIGTPQESLYQPVDAFDTPYHLVEPAAYRHTRRLAAELLPHLRGRKFAVMGSAINALATP